MKIQNLPCVVLIIASAIGLSLCGCSPKTGDKPEHETQKQIVIKVNGKDIDGAVVENYLKNRPIPMNSENSGELLKKRLDDLVVEELLFQEALRLQLDQAPETRQRIKELLNKKLLDEQIRKQVMQRKVEQAELQAYYDAHQQEFSRQEEIRVADLFIAVPRDASDGRRLELKRKAETLLAEALASKNKRVDFPLLIQKHSDKPEKYTRGDTGFFNAEGKPAGIDRAIVEAAFKLEKTGHIANAVIQATDGYHIIMLMGKHEAFKKPVELVARHLEKQIKNEKIQKEQDEYIQKLKEKARVEINDEELSRLQEKLKSTGNIQPTPPGNITQPSAAPGKPAAAPAGK